MDWFASSMEDEAMSLRELAIPSMEDLVMQKSDLALATTHYELKNETIELVVTNPFRGLEDDNPYRHLERFTMICNTLSGIFFRSLSKMKRKDRTNLHPLKRREIGMSSRRNFAQNSFP